MIGRKYLVRVTDWPADNHYPNGLIVQSLGEENNYLTDSLAILYEVGVGVTRTCERRWRAT